MSQRMIKEGLYPSNTATLGLRPLPPHVRYIDEYDDSVKTIRDLAVSDIWLLKFDTHTRPIDFGGIMHAPSKTAFKWMFVWLLADLSPATVAKYAESFSNLLAAHGHQWICKLITRTPLDWASDWELLRPSLSEAHACFLKGCMYFLSEMQIGEWNLGLEPFIRSLPFPPGKAKYRGILSGEAFLTIREESLIVEFLDETARSIRAGTEVSPSQIIDHCLLTFCYEHGFRPVQIGRIPLSAVKSLPTATPFSRPIATPLAA